MSACGLIPHEILENTPVEEPRLAKCNVPRKPGYEKPCCKILWTLTKTVER